MILRLLFQLEWGYMKQDLEIFMYCLWRDCFICRKFRSGLNAGINGEILKRRWRCIGRVRDFYWYRVYIFGRCRFWINVWITSRREFFWGSSFIYGRWREWVWFPCRFLGLKWGDWLHLWAIEKAGEVLNIYFLFYMEY